MKGPRDTGSMGCMTRYGYVYGPDGARARRMALQRVSREQDRKDYLYMRHAISIHRSNRP